MGLWTAFSLEKEFTKKVSASIDQEFRFCENITRIDQIFTNPCVTYKISKRFKIGLGYRMIDKYAYKSQTFDIRHRLLLDLSYRYKVERLTISYRSRVQGEVKNNPTAVEEKSPCYFWRNKIDIKYIYGEFSPLIGCELMCQVVDPENMGGNYEFNRLRSYVGVDYEINSSNSIGLTYMIQKEFNIVDPGTDYIIGLEYSIVLERSKKKKKDKDND